jgi:hypothetical protein
MTREHEEWYAGTTLVSAYGESDFPDWEDAAKDPARSPLTVLRRQRQPRNDCQGQSLANGEEKRRWFVTGEMVQLSDSYAYNGSERVAGTHRVGDDAGTSIQSGVQLLTEGIRALSLSPGLPLDSVWPIDRYFRSSRKFDAAAKQLTIDQTFVSEHLPMPPFRDLCACLVGGGSGHIGTYWRVSWAKINGIRCMKSAPTGGGGHATEIVWPVFIGGQWYLATWNSHGDGYYLIPERVYEDLRASNFRPFGARLLMPDKAPERFVDWINDSPWN